MSCEHLVCANCAHPVAEGRCSTCRAARDHLHAASVPSSYAVIFGIALLLLALLALLGRQLTG